MPRTIGYHLVKSAFGLWLPGDDRGHWSEAWDDAIGYTQPHTLNHGDPVRHRMAAERMAHEPARFNVAMINVIAETIGRCATQSDWSIAAAAIEPTHAHLLITYTQRHIDNTVKWLADQTTKSIHKAATAGRGLEGIDDSYATRPIWAKGKWCRFIYDQPDWQNVIAYIERHNHRAGRPTRPYPWIT